MCLLCLVQQVSAVEDRVVRLEDRLSIEVFMIYIIGATFKTTGMPFSASTLVANSDPRYDSRLYRWLVAKTATAGGPPNLGWNILIYLSLDRQLHS